MGDKRLRPAEAFLFNADMRESTWRQNRLLS